MLTRVLRLILRTTESGSNFGSISTLSAIKLCLKPSLKSIVLLARKALTGFSTKINNLISYLLKLLNLILLNLLDNFPIKLVSEKNYNLGPIININIKKLNVILAYVTIVSILYWITCLSIHICKYHANDFNIQVFTFKQSEKIMHLSEIIIMLSLATLYLILIFRFYRTNLKIQAQYDFMYTALDSLNHSFYVIDAKSYKVVYANSCAAPGGFQPDILCYSLTHKIDKPCSSVSHTCPLGAVIKSKRPVIVEHLHYDNDGKPKYVESHTYPIFDKNHNVVQVIEYNLDITKRKQTEQALLRSEKLYSETIDHLPLHLAVADKNGKYLIWNNHSEKIFGYSQEEVVGKMNHNNIIKKNNHASNLYENAIKYGMSDTNIELMDKNGKTFPAHIIIVPIFQSPNNHSGYIELVQDLTQIEENKIRVKKLSKELFESEENQRKKLRAELHDETGVMITATKFNCNMIKKLIDLGRYDEISLYIDSIISNTNTLSSGLRKLFNNLTPANINQTGILYAINDYLSKVNINNKLSIETDISTEIEDNNIIIKVTLYRIIQEAITNVIRHADAQNVSITLTKNNDNNYLRISDNGKGFNPQEIIENSYGLKGICDRISELEGICNLNSEPGKGTSLEVTLPALKGEY